MRHALLLLMIVTVAGCASAAQFAPLAGQSKAQRDADYESCRAGAGPRPGAGSVILDALLGGLSSDGACVMSSAGTCRTSVEPDATDAAMAVENRIYSCMAAKGYPMPQASR